MTVLDVSVVVPCYNAADTLLRCLDSVEYQTAKPREIIVVDDGSDVPAMDIAEGWKENSEIPLRIIRQENAGAAAARDVGCKLAVGQYIAFLDADDIWFPKKLEIQYEAMIAGDLTVSGHGYVFQMNGSENSAYAGKSYSIKKIFKWHFAYKNPFFTPTVMVRRDKFSGFDRRFRRVDDYKAWLESYLPGRCGYICTILAGGFKPPLGHSGLTASVDKMHESFIEVLKVLMVERKIGYIFYGAARLIEAVKLPIRKFKVQSVKVSC